MSHFLLELSRMAISGSHAPVIGLLCLLASVSGNQYQPCLDRDLVLGLRYVPATGDFTGYVSLDNTLSAIVIENDTVVHIHPQLRLDDVRREINFTASQRNFSRVLCGTLMNVSVCSIVYTCNFGESSCDVTCVFDDKYVKGTRGKPTSSYVDDPQVASLCAEGHGLSTLYDAWEDVLGRWKKLCAYFEGRGDRVAMSFRYDPGRRLTLCNFSLEDPVTCMVVIRIEGSDVAGPSFCKRRGDMGSGIVVEYPIETDREVVLTCTAISTFVQNQVSLTVPNRTYSPKPGSSEGFGPTEGPAEPRTSHGTGLGLSVGFPCAFLLAAVVVVLLFRRRLGLRVCDRTFPRVAYRTADGHE